MLHDRPAIRQRPHPLGHAVNKILKDIIVKSRYLAGFDAPYVPGWDCHGLPIEIAVEKRWGKVGTKLDAVEFRQKCREFAEEQINIQRVDFKRLGVTGDWDNPYKTLRLRFRSQRDPRAGQGRGQRPPGPRRQAGDWCFDCGSALAEAEIEYQEKESPAIDVATLHAMRRPSARRSA